MKNMTLQEIVLLAALLTTLTCCYIVLQSLRSAWQDIRYLSDQNAILYRQTHPPK